MSSLRHDFISVGNSSLKYFILEGGDNVMICFHGFGQDHSVFKTIHESLKGTHTLYSFDLFFHGESQYNRGEESFYPSDWFSYMELFLKKHTIERFELMGFSLGGKFAMVTATLFPDRVNHLHLLSPDGIKTHFSYRFSTYPYLIRKLFKTQIHHPGIFHGLVRLMRFLKWMNNYTLRFAETQMDTPEKRAQVYYTWVVFRHFKPDLKELAQLVNSHQFELTIYLGKYDKVINRKEVDHLVRLLENATCKEVESGHSRLIQAVATSFSSGTG